jgi:hypothetical protein
MRDVKIVDERTPGSVLVQDRVREANQLAGALGEDRAGRSTRLAQALGPHRQAVLDDLAVEEGVGVRTSIVMAPAVGMKRGNRVRVGRTGRSKP